MAARAGDATVVGGAFNFVFGGVTFHYTGVPEDGVLPRARMREDLLGAGSEYGIGCGSDLDRNGACGNFFACSGGTPTTGCWSTRTTTSASPTSRR